MSGTPPHGLLRLFVVFHEPEALGAGRSVLRALEPLAAYGWTASAWIPGEGPLVEEAAPLVADVTARAKPLRYSLRGWRAEPGVVQRVRAAPAYLRDVRQALLAARPHVVHVNTLRALPEARVAHGLGLPVVLHVHELPPSGAKRRLALRAAARFADVLVAVSEAVADVVRPHAGSTPVLVAPNGVAVADAVVPAASTGVVGSLGTVCRTKGTDVLLRAAALARRRADLRFEVVGQRGLDEDEAFDALVTELAGADELAGGVALLGREPAADALARWELFVLASRQDAFPLATLEAMATGVPVVATAVGGIREQVEHLRTGVLVPPEDPEALAEWIVRLHEDEPLRRRLAEAAAAEVRERFTPERQAAVLHRAYLAALNLRHGPPPVRAGTFEAAA